MQLLEHFKVLTLHPKNAQELKGLILQLAVQGKLTKQWRMNNRPALNSKELLDKIKIGKKNILRESNVKSEKPINDFDPSEVKFDLPQNWVWVRFASAAYICRGGSPRPIKNFITDEADGINWIKIGDTKGVLKYIEECEEKIIPEGLKMSRLVVPGDFILSNSMSFGRPYIMKTTGCIHDGWLLIREVKEAIDKDFLYHMLSSPYVYGSFKDSAAGGVVQNLNIEKVRQTLIPLPPLEEQKAIVEVINQLFAEVELLETLTKERIQLKADFVTSALNQLTQAAEQDTASQWTFLQQHFSTFFTEKENIKKLREGILQLAVQGKLTRDWRAIRQGRGTLVEPAATLLEKIKAEKEKLVKAGKIKKEKPLPEISEEEIPYELPVGWVWCRLGDYVQCERGRFSARPRNSPEYFDGEYPFIQIGEINQNGGQINSHRQTLNQKGLKISKMFPKGTIVIAIVGATIGGTGILGYEMCFPDSLVGIKPSPNFNSEYLEKYLRTRKMEFQEISYAGGGQPNIKLPTLNESLFSLPPLEEQKIIVEKVNRLIALCDKLEQEIETHQTTQEQWMQSCLRGVV